MSNDKTKVITTSQEERQLKVKTRKRHRMPENGKDQSAVGFAFTSDLIRSGVEFAGLFREQNDTNNKANADFYRHSAEKSFHY